MTGEKDRFTTVEKLWKLDDETLTTPEHDQMVLWLLNKNNILKLFPELESIKTHIEIKSEVPVLTKNRFIVGYWDVIISFKNITGINTDFNPPIPIGFDVRYFIEVKPKIKSFGATLRQIKTYLTYDHLLYNRVFIFTTDLRFKEAFQSQGINILKYEMP